MNPILPEHIESAKKKMKSMHGFSMSSWSMDEYIGKLIMMASAAANKEASLLERYQWARDYLTKNGHVSVLRYLDSKESEILQQISDFESKNPSDEGIKGSIQQILNTLGLKADIIDTGKGNNKVACNCMKCQNERKRAAAEGREDPTLVEGEDVLALQKNEEDEDQTSFFFKKKSKPLDRLGLNETKSSVVECEVYFMPAIGQQPLFSVFRKGELPEQLKTEFGQYLFDITVPNSEHEIKSIPEKLKAIFQIGVDLTSLKNNKGW